MKKFIKCLSVICFAILLVCPLALAGCSKNYTITINCQGSGQVLLEGSGSGESVEGKNVVKKGDMFEYLVKPDTHFEIAEIKIDGKLYTESYAKDGAYLSFENVKANHKVTIVFAAVEYTVKLMCSDGEYTSFEHNSAQKLDMTIYCGEETDNIFWYYLKSDNSKFYIINGQSNSADDPAEGYEVNKIFVTKDNFVLTVDMTVAELTELIGAAD